MSDGLADFLNTKTMVIAADCSEDNWGLVIEHPTGVHWTAQVGGYACLHPVVEGFFLPLESGPVEELREFFYGESGPWKGWCSEGIDEKTANWLDPQLPKGLRVDRDRLDEGRESWIPVVGTISDWLGGNVGTIHGFLTWENSD